jgi:hypothetical protein
MSPFLKVPVGRPIFDGEERLQSIGDMFQALIQTRYTSMVKGDSHRA